MGYLPSRMVAPDDLEQAVRWQGGREVCGLAGTPVRLRFVLRDAEIFSFRFRE